jgi:carboxymethylenebutenolidase
VLAGLGGLAAQLWLAHPAEAVLVAADDNRLTTSTVTFPAASGEMQAYLVRPAGFEGRLPAVIIVHESSGLHPHIRDVARRMGLAGYMVLAPDLLSTRGGMPVDPAAVRERIAELDTDPVVADLVSAMTYLRLRPDGGDSVAAVGFGWGGGVAARLATVAPSLGASVVFYGRVPGAKEAVRITTPMLVVAAALDTKTNERLPEFQTTLGQSGTRLQVQTYAGVGYGFLNDTVPNRYNSRAAEEAWTLMVDFLKSTIG